MFAKIGTEAVKRWGRKLLTGARAAHENEDGGTMVFGAMTLFTLVVFTMLVYQIGMTSGDKIQLQTAADNGAYSAALVEAESLESIAFLNDGMAFVYYAECRYTIDAIVYGTLHAFERQTEWVQQFNPNALQQYQEGPWNITEDTFGPNTPINNPGVYAQGRNPRLPLQGQQNYKAGVEPTSGIGANATAVKDYNWVMLGQPDNGTDVFVQRLESTKKHVRDLVPKGKLWLADIHWAERIILAATPQLVRATAVKVALMNGAQAVAVSDDVERVFAIATPATHGKYPEAGFAVNPGNRVDPDLARRYQDRTNPVDQKARGEKPTWFDFEAGEANSPYTQVRICWNRRDWDHQQQNPPNGYSSHDQYPPNFSKAPAGHWHMIHTHNLDDVDPTGMYPPVGPFLRYADGGEPGGDGISFHDFGHGVSSGDDASQHDINSQPQLVDAAQGDFTTYGNPQFSQVDTGAANQTHHAAQLCPTCSAYDPTSANYGQVVHFGPTGNSGGQSDADWALSLGDETPNFPAGTATVIHFDTGAGETFPRPLRLTPQVLRAGITVATWRPSRSLGNIFKASDFGLLSIATAQVGVRTGDGKVLVLLDDADPSSGDPKNKTVILQDGSKITLEGSGSHSPANFYLDDFKPGAGTDPEGLRFGARLVPVGRNLSWVLKEGASAANAAGDGLTALLGLNNPTMNKRWWTSAPASATGSGPPGSLVKLQAVLDVGAFAPKFPQ